MRLQNNNFQIVKTSFNIFRRWFCKNCRRWGKKLHTQQSWYHKLQQRQRLPRDLNFQRNTSMKTQIGSTGRFVILSPNESSKLWRSKRQSSDIKCIEKRFAIDTSYSVNVQLCYLILLKYNSDISENIISRTIFKSQFIIKFFLFKRITLM